MELKLEPQDGYLLAAVSGHASLEEAIKCYKQAHDNAASRGMNKILVDCSAVEGVLSELEKYELGRSMAEYSLGSAMKVAKVTTPPAIAEFVSLVASNRGLTAATFSNRQAAVRWLSSFGAKASVS